MSITRQYETKHYGGLESELPIELPYGDTYFSTDTNRIFRYNEDRRPKLVGRDNPLHKFVDSANDFPKAIGGIRYLLDEGTYIITSHIDLEGDRLICGRNTTLLGESSENCSITSTGIATTFPGNYMMESDYTVPIRHITFKDVPRAIIINPSNTGVQPIALDWTGVNFSGCDINLFCKDIDNFIFTKGAILGSGVMTFDGSVGTMGINDSLFQGSGSAHKLIEFTSNAIVTRRIKVQDSSIVAFGSTIGVDVSTSATIPTESYILDKVNFSGGGTYLSGVDHISNKSLFSKNKGIENTAVNGQLYMQDNATVTPIATSGVFYKILGSTSASVDNQKYTATDNRLTNNATIARKYLIQCNLSFTSGNNKVCEFGFYDSKLGAIRTPSKTKSTSNGSGRAENISFNCVVSHSDGDYLEIWCANNTDTANIIVTDLNFVITDIV